MSKLDGIRVKVTNPKHPHFGETGTLTGKTIKLITGTIMAEVEPDDLNDGYYVRPNDIERL